MHLPLLAPWLRAWVCTPTQRAHHRPARETRNPCPGPPCQDGGPRGEGNERAVVEATFEGLGEHRHQVALVDPDLHIEPSAHEDVIPEAMQRTAIATPRGDRAHPAPRATSFPEAGNERLARVLATRSAFEVVGLERLFVVERSMKGGIDPDEHERVLGQADVHRTCWRAPGRDRRRTRDVGVRR